jgi:hypothetical protein
MAESETVYRIARREAFMMAGMNKRRGARMCLDGEGLQR